MTLSPAWLDELRARTTLSAIIAPSVKLTKAGREFKACCPFHNEKTPSFTVNDEKGFYHCFGCGAHGDAIRFLTDQRGLPFMDAVKELALKAGMEVPAPDPQARERAERQAGLIDVTEAAAAWFQEQLGGIEGGAARDYLEKRGIGAETIARFGLGYAPDHKGKLKRALDRFGVPALVETGMLIQPDDGREAYDRFRGRLMIPIRDARGRAIAFGGRIIGEGEPKYLNSPETPLFDKGRTLYNLDRASPASRQAGRLIVVEGYMDVIALDRAGIAEAVAPNGTAVTETQLERMWRLDPQPILCFDGDAAGQKAAIRAALRALPLLGPARTLRFVALPAGQDPDDLLRTGGREAVHAALAQTEPLVERLWRHEAEAEPLTTPEARAGLKQRVMDHAAAIGDPSLRQLYREEFLRRFDALVRPQRERWSATKPRPSGRQPRWGGPTEAERYLQATRTQDKTRVRARDGENLGAALVLGHALFPQAISDHVEQFAALRLADRAAGKLRDRMIDLAVSDHHLDRDHLLPILADGETAAAWADVSSSGDIGFSFTRPRTDPDLARRDLALAVEALVTRAEIDAALTAATRRLEQEFTDSAYAEQQRLRAARNALNDRLASLAGNE